jgi:hypothetical protein
VVCASWPDAEEARLKAEIRGWMRKMSGKIAIPMMMVRLRRYSRSSLR